MTEPAVGASGMRVGQPGVEWEHRHLDGEADEEGPEDPLLQAQGQRELHQFRDFEGVAAELLGVLEVERQNASSMSTPPARV